MPLWKVNCIRLALLVRCFSSNSFSTGHKFLCDRGILHRDISPGNVMLSQDPNPPPGYEGFIIDLELAHCRRPVVGQYIRQDSQSTFHPSPSISIQTHTAWDSVSVQYGAEISVSKKPIYLSDPIFLSLVSESSSCRVHFNSCLSTF